MKYILDLFDPVGLIYDICNTNMKRNLVKWYKNINVFKWINPEMLENKGQIHKCDFLFSLISVFTIVFFCEFIERENLLAQLEIFLYWFVCCFGANILAHYGLNRQ